MKIKFRNVKMKAIIIEDEKPAARRMSRLLESLDIEVVAILHSVKEAVVWLEQNDHPSLGFFDIQLSDGLSFEILELVDIRFPLIFTTAYDEYAIKAFKHNSVDYLLKPINEEELQVAIDKYETIYKSEPRNLQAEQLKNLLKELNPKSYKSRFSIKVGQKYKLVNTSEISCFYSEQKGTYINTSGGNNYPIDTPLEHLETIVDPSVFYRVNRKFIVNIDYIKDIIAYSNSRLKVTLTNDSKHDIVVSRERVKEFKAWLG